MQNECLFCSWWHTISSLLSKHNTTPAVTEQTRWSGSLGEEFDLHLPPRLGSPEFLKLLCPGKGSWRTTRLLRASRTRRGEGVSREIKALYRTQHMEKSNIRVPNVSITNLLKITGRRILVFSNYS